MPIDPSMSAAMLSTFRTMAAECEAKGFSGPAYDAMQAELAKMERYAVEMSDFGAFSGRLVQENCFTLFSQHYGQVLGDAARAEAQQAEGANAASGADPDAGLLARTLTAYEGAADRYREEQAAGRLSASDAAAYIEAVEAVLALGKSGVTYPSFLRILVEKGLDTALEGGVVARRGLERDLEWAEFEGYPLPIQRQKAQLAAYDELAAAAAFGVPDPLGVELRRQRIAWEFEPKLARWAAVTRRWQNLLTLVNDWLDAHTAFAPTDDRWATQDPARTRRNIRRTQEVAPYQLRAYIRIFSETCGLGWDGIFGHETFQVAWRVVDVELTAEKLQVVRQARPLCVPGGAPARELIARAEQLRAGKGDHRTAERQAQADRRERRYDQFYGEGAYRRDFPA